MTQTEIKPARNKGGRPKGSKPFPVPDALKNMRLAQKSPEEGEAPAVTAFRELLSDNPAKFMDQITKAEAAFEKTRREGRAAHLEEKLAKGEPLTPQAPTAAVDESSTNLISLFNQLLGKLA